MSNYNERLDEVLSDYADEHRNHAYEFDNKEISQYEYFELMRNDKEKAKQAITSLIKELVAEAKPGAFKFDDGQNDATHFYNKAVSEYQQNLLKALETRE